MPVFSKVVGDPFLDMNPLEQENLSKKIESPNLLALLSNYLGFGFRSDIQNPCCLRSICASFDPSGISFQRFITGANGCRQNSRLPRAPGGVRDGPRCGQTGLLISIADSEKEQSLRQN